MPRCLDSRSQSWSASLGFRPQRCRAIDAIGASVGTQLDVARFRPSILVEAADPAPFAEDDWVGCILCIGTMRMRVDKRDGRCAIITIDPMTTERRPEILRTVAQDRQGCLGVYGTTVTGSHRRH